MYNFHLCIWNHITTTSKLTEVYFFSGMAIFCDSKLLNIYIISVILGLCKGTKAVYQSLIIPKYVTLDKLPAATGLSMVLNGVLSLAIGPLIGK